MTRSTLTREKPGRRFEFDVDDASRATLTRISEEFRLRSFYAPGESLRMVMAAGFTISSLSEQEAGFSHDLLNDLNRRTHSLTCHRNALYTRAGTIAEGDIDGEEALEAELAEVSSTLRYARGDFARHHTLMAEAYRAVLSAVRGEELSPVHGFTVDISDPVSSRLGPVWVSHADVYPASWYEKAERFPLTLRETEGRSYYHARKQGETGRVNELALPAGEFTTAKKALLLHELAHYFESVIPDIAIHEAMFLSDRIRRNPARASLRYLVGDGGQDDEFGYADLFRYGYTGRVYRDMENAGLTDLTVLDTGRGLEILSTGVEGLFAGSHHVFYGRESGPVFNMDTGLRDFVLGLLALIARR